MGFPRQEYWSGLPFPPPGDGSSPGIEPESPVSPPLAGGFITASATWEALLYSNMFTNRIDASSEGESTWSLKLFNSRWILPWRSEVFPDCVLQHLRRVHRSAGVGRRIELGWSVHSVASECQPPALTNHSNTVSVCCWIVLVSGLLFA